METVVVRFEDGTEKRKTFNTMDEAQAFQEKLVFTYGLDAEVE